MADAPHLAAQLARIPSLGWIDAPSPVARLEGLEGHLGAGWLGVKRDDQLARLHGGTKLRKLDLLLAEPRFREAAGWASVGAIGSGHLAATTAAAAALGKGLDGYLFWEPPSAGVLENLAFTASGARTLRYHGSRTALGLAHPTVLWATDLGGVPLIPAGATTPQGTVGVLLGGLELAAQIAAGLLPAPDRVYVALGSGGTAAGLALGLGLAGLRTEVRAVAAVERVAASLARVRALVRGALRWLAARGLTGLDARRAAPVRVVHGQLGAGYGVPTAASLAACELAAQEGLALEPIYTGKAFAALADELVQARGQGLRLLFWHTARRGPLPAAPGWRERLPAPLLRRLDAATSSRRSGRRALLGAGAAAAAAVAVARTTGYEELSEWTGTVLSAREAQIFAAAAEVLLPERSGPAPLEVAANVDRYLRSMPPAVQLQIHALLALVEHGPGPLALRLRRFTALPPDAREAYLGSLRARGGLLAQAYRGLRDLALLGHYQSPAAWPELGYDGPWGDAAGPALGATPYEALRAPAGARPRGTETSG